MGARAVVCSAWDINSYVFLSAEYQSNNRVLGANKRAGTPRNARTEVPTWLAAAHEVSFPTQVVHVMDYLQLRHSEPCNRGAQKIRIKACFFLEKVAGIDEAAEVTNGTARRAREFPAGLFMAVAFKQRPRL